MPARERGVIFTGARARFLLNGERIGWATTVSGRESIEYEPVKVLDNIQVQEHVPLAYDTELSASVVRIVGKTPKSQGFFPQLGTDAEEHLQNILTNGEMSAQIEDNATGTVLYLFEQVRVANHNWTINARGIVGNDMVFVAIRQRDESEV